MKDITEISIVLFNLDMMKALGESDKPAIILKLTEEQQKILASQEQKGYTILSIHPVIKD